MLMSLDDYKKKYIACSSMPQVEVRIGASCQAENCPLNLPQDHKDSATYSRCMLSLGKYNYHQIDTDTKKIYTADNVIVPKDKSPDIRNKQRRINLPAPTVFE